MSEAQYIVTDKQLSDILGILGEVAKTKMTPVHTAQPATTPEVSTDTGFRWGPRSLAELKGVKHELLECATLALTRYSEVDFMCYDGIRTKDEQAHYVKIGTSQTMDSKHLPQPDGFGHAVDLVPVVGGIPKWDWDLIYKIALAMDLASSQLGIANHIRWGGAWDKTLADFGNDADAYKQATRDYADRHPGKDFLDGPHFEWKD